jgi:hypothetical protein
VPAHHRRGHHRDDDGDRAGGCQRVMHSDGGRRFVAAVIELHRGHRYALSAAVKPLRGSR